MIRGGQTILFKVFAIFPTKKGSAGHLRVTMHDKPSRQLLYSKQQYPSLDHVFWVGHVLERKFLVVNFIVFYCLPELALGRPRITQRPCVCVCVSVMYGIELWIYWTDFNATLVTVHCHSLVVHCKIWKGLLAPFTFFGGMGYPWFPY